MAPVEILEPTDPDRDDEEERLARFRRMGLGVNTYSGMPTPSEEVASPPLPHVTEPVDCLGSKMVMEEVIAPRPPQVDITDSKEECPR